jgi:hypothetical protein
MGSIVEAKDKVLTMLTEGMNLKVQVGKENKISVRFDDLSTAVFFNFTEQEFDGDAAPQTFVYITAPILRNVPPSDKLYKWISIQGTGFRLGCVEAFESEDGTLFLRYKYVLLADFLDEDELSTAMWSVLHTADDLDDILQKEYGGKRWVDED